jgi:hypothetical protein
MSEKTQKVIQECIQKLEQEAEIGIRDDAYNALITSGADAVPALIELLEKENVSEGAKWAAVEILGQIRSPQAIPALTAILKISPIEEAAYKALHRIGTPAAIEAAEAWRTKLIKLSLLRKDDGEIREATLRIEPRYQQDQIPNLGLEHGWQLMIEVSEIPVGRRYLSGSTEVRQVGEHDMYFFDIRLNADGLEYLARLLLTAAAMLKPAY